jgi:hypothetical protein
LPTRGLKAQKRARFLLSNEKLLAQHLCGFEPYF